MMCFLKKYDLGLATGYGRVFGTLDGDREIDQSRGKLCFSIRAQFGPHPDQSIKAPEIGNR